MTETRLSGKHVTLELMQPKHSEELVKAASDGELWKLWFTSVAAPENMDEYIARALAMQQAQTAIPFVVRFNQTREIIGSTRICNRDLINARSEIGYTWYAKSFQRTAVNTECKLLLLTYAFETLNCVAVEFRTHWFNHRSREAIARLGAKQDGVLRKHTKMPDGNYRDTVVFSIIDTEWYGVKQHLMFKLEP